MVRVLIGLRRTIARHEIEQTNPASLVAAALLALLSAVGTLLLGWVRYPHVGTAADVLALVSALWIGGRIAQSALSGEPILRPEIFSVLPLPRRRLGWSLLVVGLLDPAQLFVTLALSAVLVRGAQLGPAATSVGVLAVVLTVAVARVLSTVASGLLGPGSRRGHDAATVVTAVLISLLAVAGTLLPALVSALRHRSAPWLSALLRVLPSGWGPLAVESAGRSDVLGAAVPLVGLALLGLGAALVWPTVLSRRMAAIRPARRGSTAEQGHRSFLPRTPTGAVVAKEIRTWLRDPIRLTCLVIALVVGTGVCVLPRVTSGTAVLLPFAGTMSVVIAAACACNLYGSDGSSVWLTMTTPHSAQADVRGRQLAWLVVVAPYAIVATVVLTAVSGQLQAWPWTLGLLFAVLGGGAGLAPLASLVFVQPLDDAGNPTPAWSLKIHVALVAVALTGAPVVVALLSGLRWFAVPLGLVWGSALGIWLARRAIARFARVDQRVALLRTLAGSAG